MSKLSIIGSYFFEEVTVTSARYINMMNTQLLWLSLADSVSFQQEGTIARTARNSMNILRKAHTELLISRYEDVP